MDATGKGLVEFWSWAIEKGLINRNTGYGMRAACRQVLGVLENWEEVDLRGLNIDDLLRRFENLRKHTFPPSTLAEYQRRFRNGLESYLGYLQNPSGWKAPGKRTQRPRVRQESERSTQSEVQPPRDGSPAIDGVGGLVEYPFPLRPSVIARLRLPADLRREEVARITRFLESLSVDLSSNE